MNPGAHLSPIALALAQARVALTRRAAERPRSSSPAAVQALGLGAVQVGGATALYAASVAWAGANSIVHLGLEHPATWPDLQELMEPFRDHQLPFTVILGPLARPAPLPTWLLEAGLVEQDSQWVLGLILPGEPMEEGGGLAVQRLTAGQQADFARIILGEEADAEHLAYVGRPPAPDTHRYGVVLDGHPVAAAQMTVAGRLVHFSGAATLPTFRGRGAQGTLLRRRLEDAVSAGCDRATVEVAVNNGASLRNVERAGFRRHYQERRFLWTPPEAQERP